MSIELVTAFIGLGMSGIAALLSVVRTFARVNAERLIVKRLSDHVRANRLAEPLKLEVARSMVGSMLETMSEAEARAILHGLSQPAPEGQKRYLEKLITEAMEHADTKEGAEA